MANDTDPTLVRIIRILGDEYGPLSVALAAAAVPLNEHAREELLARLNAMASESGSWSYEITEGDVGKRNVYIRPIPDKPGLDRRISVFSLLSDVIKSKDVGKRISGHLTSDFTPHKLKIESAHQRNMRITHDAHVRAMASDQEGQENR